MCERHIQEILVIAHNPNLPEALTGGIVINTMIPKYSDGNSPATVLGELSWTSIEEVDRELEIFRRAKAI